MKNENGAKAIEHLDLLGRKVEDRVTGQTGVVTSISFDLYGCIQAVVHPPVKEDGSSKGEAAWYDINRLKVSAAEPVMERPDFVSQDSAVANGMKGPAQKPLK